MKQYELFFIHNRLQIIHTRVFAFEALEELQLPGMNEHLVGKVDLFSRFFLFHGCYIFCVVWSPPGAEAFFLLHSAQLLFNPRVEGEVVGVGRESKFIS